MDNDEWRRSAISDELPPRLVAAKILKDGIERRRKNLRLATLNPMGITCPSMSEHHEHCDVNDVNPDGIKKPCNCEARNRAALQAELSECHEKNLWLVNEKLRLEKEVADNERWMREVLTDFRIPFDDHTIGRRLAFTYWMFERQQVKS